MSKRDACDFKPPCNLKETTISQPVLSVRPIQVCTGHLYIYFTILITEQVSKAARYNDIRISVLNPSSLLSFLVDSSPTPMQ
jgi:hypothetical protein